MKPHQAKLRDLSNARHNLINQWERLTNNPVGRGRGKSAEVYICTACGSLYKAKGESQSYSFLLKLLQLYIYVPLVACSLGHSHRFHNHRHSSFPGQDHQLHHQGRPVSHQGPRIPRKSIQHHDCRQYFQRWRCVLPLSRSKCCLD